MRVAFLTRSLEVGGAEVQLVQTAGALQGRGHDVTVVAFYDRGPLSGDLQDAGVALRYLGKKSRWDLVGPTIRAIRYFRVAQPDVVHSFLTPANILAAVIRPFLGGTALVWGIRASFMDWSAYDVTWRIAYGVERFLSRFPDAIVTNSRAGLAKIRDDGFRADNAVAIPNGIDLDRFKKICDTSDVRSELGLPPEKCVLGIVARLDPMKSHDVFLRAAAILRTTRDDVHFLIVGGDGLVPRASLESLQKSLGLQGVVTWAGHRNDTPAIYSVMDVHTSSSKGEGFSNSVAEGMACEVATVATDVGDSRYIVGDAGRVVPSEDPAALAAAWSELLSMADRERRQMGSDARARVTELCSEEAMTDRILDVYLRVAG